MKRKYESATAFLRRKHPVLKAAMDYGFALISKELRFIVVMFIMSGAFTFSSCRHSNLEKKVEGLATVQTNIIQYIQ
jgi:hypothetical protein